MTKFLNLCFVIIIGFFMSSFFASPASAKTLKLNPNETKLLTNSAPWTLNATCTIQGQHNNKSKIRISVLKNKGTVNGRSLATGQGTSVIVKNNSSISVSAEAGTQINLINMGGESLEAICI